MKYYDCIAIGTGSAMAVVQGLLNENPGLQVAVVDKDEPGGLCLTRACIPSKLLVYPAEVLRQVQEAAYHGIDLEIRDIDFQAIMERMRSTVSQESRAIEKGLSESENIDYYRGVAEFKGPSTMQVGAEQISGDMVLLCAGSRPLIPDIPGLEKVKYLTSDTVLELQTLPESLIILGGGYVAAEYGHFFSAMGSKVTILGRNPQFLPQEEPEVSTVAKLKMAQHMHVLTNHEVVEVQAGGQVKVRVHNRGNNQLMDLEAEKLLIAAGRASNADLLQTDKTGLETDSHGWLMVNEHMQTSVKNIWAFGDATGQHLFKHVANHEARAVYSNAVLKEPMTIDYHAVPHAVFTHPEIAGVGMKEAEAVAAYGEDGVLIGFQPFEETARGQAMGVQDCFVKVILEESTDKILGAHVIGPQASLLIQEIITLMYTSDQSPVPLVKAMHIHPALSEVVYQAFFNLMLPRDYQHLLSHRAPELFK